MTGVALVAGAVAQRRGFGGHAWAFAAYVHGLRSLGFEVVFIDRWIGTEPPQVGDDPAFELLGGPSRTAVLDADGRSIYGLSRSTVLDVARRADVVLNVMGFLDDEEILAGPRRRVFLDIDPGFPQLWCELGLADVFAGHDAYVTVGSAIHDSGVPTCGLTWIPTLPPVYLPEWPVVPPAPSAPVTSVVSWRGPFGPIEHQGRTYGLRAHEFRRFLDLPGRTGSSFQLALHIDPADDRDRRALLDHDWTLADPLAVAGTPQRYRDYIAGSRAELMIAKHLYVATGAGWFSDRSACYLASGRPVVAQDTGVAATLPTGEGLLTFSTPDEAVAAIDELSQRYADRCAAARAVAEDHLSTDVVLPRLLNAVLR